MTSEIEVIGTTPPPTTDQDCQDFGKVFFFLDCQEFLDESALPPPLSKTMVSASLFYLQSVLRVSIFPQVLVNLSYGCADILTILFEFTRFQTKQATLIHVDLF